MKKILFFCWLFSTSVSALELVPLKQVTLLESPFLHAQETNKHYLLSLDAEKLLAPFRREAGLPFDKSYGNWESSGLDGHMGGHYVSALAILYASTRDQQVLERLNYVIDELKKCQDKNGNGYIGGIPEGQKAWSEIKAGDIRADNFSTNNRWVPWYNLHKTFAGLRDAYTYAGNKKAKRMLIDLSEWAFTLTHNLSAAEMQQMLRTEHGGMNEIFVDVAGITGDKKYLQLAERFSHQAILKPLEKQQDHLTGLHANTQIPKVIGFERYASVTQNPEWHNAATFFWNTLVNNRSVAIGGNSVREHFHGEQDFSSMIDEVEGPETCNTYNMLRLTELLYLATDTRSADSIRYVDYYERALYNHILSSQHPRTGGFVYFTPMRPNHYRVYSQVDQGMWCCVGSGLESHSKYGEFIYATDLSNKKSSSVFINLFIPSQLQMKKQGIALRMTSAFPDQETVDITIDKNKRFKLHIRYPSWVAAGKLTLEINGQHQSVSATPGNYIEVDRVWKKGDKIRLQLPMQTHLEKISGQLPYYAVLHGPIVLAAKTQPIAGESLNYFSDDSRMGHIASGARCPLEASPFLLGNTQDFIQKLKPVAGKPLTFDASGLINGKPTEHLQLIPFFRLHESRYTIYWPYSPIEKIEESRKAIGKAEKERIELDALTIDKVSPGEQQPESDHFYQGEKSEAGIYQDRHWRNTSAWFSYQLKDKNLEAKKLQITYANKDANRAVSVFINGQLIASEPAIDKTINKTITDSFIIKHYAIKESLIKESGGIVRVKFVVEAGVSKDIFDVRLLR